MPAARPKLTAVQRVPLPLVILLAIGVIAGVWWHGTRHHDFLTPPSEARIAMARYRATSDLVQPADLFGVERPASPLAEPIPPPAPLPEPPAEAPLIEPGDLTTEPTLDAFASHAGLPAASFIDLASKLEADTEFAWALPAWERVLDHSLPDAEERQIALNAVRRLRATIPPWNLERGEGAPVLFGIETPADRLAITRRAAKDAAAALEAASSGILQVDPTIQRHRDQDGEPKLLIVLRGPTPDSPATGSVEVPAPATSGEIETALLDAVLKLVSSQLALESPLTPPSPPEPGEEPADSLATRVTRLSWQNFAATLSPPELPAP